MRHAMMGITLVVSLAFLTAGPAFTQAQSTEATPEAEAAAPVAYVYVQTNHGVNLYDAAADGKLTLVAGSPFTTTGAMMGSNGKYFISLGTNYVHAYAVEPNGAIGRQVSEINTLDYSGGQCGIRHDYSSLWGTNGAVLDHTGRYLFVTLFDNFCSSLQTFRIAESSGELSFVGDTSITSETWYRSPTITANNEFAYLLGDGEPLYSFSRGSSGPLDEIEISETNPPNYGPLLATADPTNHLATYGLDSGVAFQLVSYTVDSAGNLITPSSPYSLSDAFPSPCTSLSMSPSGEILAVACDNGFGLFVVHFNGAAPMTHYSGVLTSDGIQAIRWDNNNHLYALSDHARKLHVYTITTTTIHEAPDSPHTMPGGPGAEYRDLPYPYGVVVVPRP